MEKALVVDDHGVSPYLKQSLEARGYSVIVVPHPKEALELMGNGLRPEIVISDVNKHPSYDGIGFARLARAHYGNDFKIYLWSGHYGDENDTSQKNPSRKVNDGPNKKSLTNQFHELFLDGIIDGFASKIPRETMDQVMIDLVDSIDFLLFASRYGILLYDTLSTDELRDLARLKFLSDRNILLSLD